MDVGKVVVPRPAVSQADAGGCENWQDLHIVEDPEIGANWGTDNEYMCLSDDIGGLIMPTRWPENSKDTILYDWISSDPADMIDAAPSDFEMDEEDQRRIVRSPELASRAAGQEGCVVFGGRIGAEQMAYSPVSEVFGDRIRTALSLPSPASSPRLALFHDRHSVTVPGTHAYIGNNKAVVMLRPGASRITLHQSKEQISIGARSYGCIVGIEFTGNIRASCVSASQPPPVGWIITDNVVRDIYKMGTGGGGSERFLGFDLDRMRDMVFERNAGYRLAACGFLRFALAQNSVYRDFAATRVGGSCVVASGSGGNGLLFERFILSMVRGIHANGFTRYGTEYGSHELRDFAVWGSTRPLSFSGAATEPPNGPFNINRGLATTNGDGHNPWLDTASPVAQTTWGTLEGRFNEIAFYGTRAATTTISLNNRIKIDNSALLQSAGTGPTVEQQESLLGENSIWQRNPAALEAAVAALGPLGARRVVYPHPRFEGVIVDLDLRDIVPDDPLGIDG